MFLRSPLSLPRGGIHRYLAESVGQFYLFISYCPVFQISLIVGGWLSTCRWRPLDDALLDYLSYINLASTHSEA